MDTAKFAVAMLRLAIAAVALCAAVCSWATETVKPNHDALVALGARLFSDKRLSADGTVSCSSCHQPEKAFSDELPVSIGIGGQKGNRNAPSLLQATQQTTFFWDGRQATLEGQVLEPFVNEREHGLQDLQALTAIVSRDPVYVEGFKVAFATESLSPDSIASALAAYVRSISAGASRFDRFWKDRQATAINGAERQGLELFRGIGCASCHAVSAPDASFTDNKFHSLSVGLAKLGPNLAKTAARAMALDERERYRSIGSDVDIAALGRFNATKNPADIGTYRTPSLRNVAVTAPYMHDGSVATLEEAVELELYYRSVQQGRLVILTPREKADLLAFLRTLTSESLEKKPRPQ